MDYVNQTNIDTRWFIYSYDFWFIFEDGELCKCFNVKEYVSLIFVSLLVTDPWLYM